MEKKSNVKRFNVFDIVIILLVIALIATFIYRIYVGVDKISGNSESKYVMTFECDSEYANILKYLKEGDAVYFDFDGVLLGYLYAGEEDEQGAVFEIIDDIPTLANGDEGNTAGEQADVDGSSVDNTIDYSVQKNKYQIIKIGGQIRLNSETVKVKNGGYYVIGDINVTEGSVINVYTEVAEFTIIVKTISLIE